MRRSLAVFALLAGWLCLCTLTPHTRLQAQSASGSVQKTRRATGGIAGRVSIKDDPAPDVAVVLLSTDRRRWMRPVARAATDADGRFRLANLPAGRYIVRPLATTAVVSERTEHNEPGESVILEDGETLDDVDFALVPGGVITGRAVDTDGEPLVSAHVRLDYLDREGSGLDLPRFTSSSRAETDDRGIYRIYGLPAGRYRVSIGDAPDAMRHSIGGRRSNVRTFHPDATEEAAAKIVEVTAGGETTDVDIKVGKLLDAFTITGRIVDADTDRPLPGRNVSIGGTDSAGRHTQMIHLDVKANDKGEFRFESLAPGRYVVAASARSPFTGSAPNTDELYGEPVISEVRDRNVTGLRLKVRRGASLSGSVIVEDETAGARRRTGFGDARLFAYIQTTGVRMGGMPDSAIINPDGSFRFVGLAPGEVYLYIQSPDSGTAGLTVLRIEGGDGGGTIDNGRVKIVAGSEVSNLRVIVAPARGSVRGRIMTATGEPVPANLRFSINMTRVDEAHPGRAFSQYAEPDERGRFIVEGLPSGEYDLTFLHPQQRGNRAAAPPPAFKPVRQRVSVRGSEPIEVTLLLEAEERQQQQQQQQQ